MTVTITDPATLAALAAAPHGGELRGPDGRLLGRFVPPFDVELAAFGLTREELDHILNDPGTEWVTGDELAARFRSIWAAADVHPQLGGFRP